ncbi:Uu.00g080210.m01.CDS01 [Anthostomella pinea]|uniref:Uu.00g080210.m01.CDS01 n=1 Tax=Anthostomella pinea TaxID=933095 RepID=A0AAI8VM35_9PEZI|nr:Uu.00g080210.m01.CDS01 [Anthostomella pinea]
MRPLPGHDDSRVGRQRPADHDLVPLMSSASSARRMSFVLADEASVDSYLEQPTVPNRFRDPRKAAEQAQKDDKNHASRQPGRDHAPPYSPSSGASHRTRSPASMRSEDQSSVSRPVTPIMIGTSCTGSAMSSPSIAGSLSDHAVSSDEEPTAKGASSMLDSGGSAPQLVMPSIRMPSRRPFTETGKNMGRLKVLLAGDSGVGKTSLVKAIVQTCEHIVHADPLPSQSEVSRRPSRSHDDLFSSRRASTSTSAVSEIYASTKPYPEWWTELDEFRASRRRKSLGDSVLERNICFVDTPGYGTGSSAMEIIVPCVEYVESFMNKVSSDSISDSDMLNMLGGDGGCQVDVVLYLISERLKPADLEYIRRLVPLTNVIPVLAQADALSPKQVAACKQEIASQLREANIRPFSFTPSTLLESGPPVPVVPYTVSSANCPDYDTMDASLLMSDDYVQPLKSTELTYLVENVLSPNGASWLRHAAAKKYLQWRQSFAPRPRHLYRPLGLPGPRNSSALARPSNDLVGPCPTSALARIAEARNNSPPRFHMVDWAADLQRSLAGERSRYEALVRGERAVWLTERLKECVQDGTLVAMNGSTEASPGRTRRGRHGLSRTKQQQDPLGLLGVTADLKARGWVALEVLGSMSVIGGLAFWLSRQHWQTESVKPLDEWARFWGMDL